MITAQRRRDADKRRYDEKRSYADEARRQLKMFKNIIDQQKQCRDLEEASLQNDLNGFDYSEKSTMFEDYRRVKELVIVRLMRQRQQHRMTNVEQKGQEYGAALRRELRSGLEKKRAVVARAARAQSGRAVNDLRQLAIGYTDDLPILPQLKLLE